MENNNNLKFFQNNMLLKEDYVELINTRGRIKFLYENASNIINLNNKTFIRENEEIYFRLDFENKKSKLLIKDNNFELSINVLYCELKIVDKQVVLRYKLETKEQEEVKIEINLEEKNEKSN